VKENLKLSAKVFEPMVEQFNALLSSLTAILQDSEDGEIDLKLKVKKHHRYDLVKDKNGLIGERENERDEMDFNWVLSRKIAAKKYDVKGCNIDTFNLEFDNEGMPVLISNEQQTMFDLVDSNNKIIK
jgi:hypothetical protein